MYSTSINLKVLTKTQSRFIFSIPFSPILLSREIILILRTKALYYPTMIIDTCIFYVMKNYWENPGGKVGLMPDPTYGIVPRQL